MTASAKPARMVRAGTDMAARAGPRPIATASPPSGHAAGGREATVHEAKTHLSRLLAEVEAGGTVVITRRGKPVAKLEGLTRRGPRTPGRLKGLIAIDERFFEPLPEDVLRAWEGE